MALDKRWIISLTSPTGAPILFAPKKDGGLWLCVDYRDLNEITIKNCYSLSLVSKIMDQLVGANVFTQLDLYNTYHQLHIHKDDEWKMAFHTQYSHFKYQVMPFRLANAPTIFQSYIYYTLSDLLNTYYIIYLDDILIYSCTVEEYTEHI